jgi:hypothetical protein
MNARALLLLPGVGVSTRRGTMQYQRSVNRQIQCSVVKKDSLFLKKHSSRLNVEILLLEFKIKR